MKHLLLIAPLFFYLYSTAQTGWTNANSDAEAKKLQFIESGEAGTLFRLRYAESNPAYTYLLEEFDSTGSILKSASFSLPDSGIQATVCSFTLDTFLNRLIVVAQFEDQQQFYLHLLALDYLFVPLDSFQFSLPKTDVDQLTVLGGGMDATANQYVVYSYRDAVDQTRGRGITSKDSNGTYKNNVFKAGQSPNDGIYLQCYAISPAGFIYCGGERRESNGGNYIYFEKMNANLVTLFEVKEQLVQNNTGNNRVSSIHLLTTASNSQVLISGTIFGLAPGDTILRSHGFIRSYTSAGVQRWNYQTFLVRDYVSVIGKNSYVHAIGSNNNVPNGLDTRITRLFNKDGVEDWNRLFGFRSAARCLQVEKDGSLLIAGDKNQTVTLPGGTNKTVRSYMLTRYSKAGKRLFNYSYSFTLPAGTTNVSACITDLATGRTGYYYLAGWERITSGSGTSAVFTDSIRTIQLTNGAQRTAAPATASEKILISPNPARNEITFTSGENVIAVNLVAAQGTTTRCNNFVQEGTTYRMDIRLLAPGLYLLQIQTKGGWSTSRFVKE